MTHFSYNVEQSRQFIRWAKSKILKSNIDSKIDEDKFFVDCSLI